MKKIILTIFFAAGLILAAAAQNTNRADAPVAIPVAKGVLVFLGKKLPKNMQYHIERSKGDNRRFEKVGDATAPTSEVEMMKRQQQYEKYFDKLDPISSIEVKALWNSLQKNNTTDSLRGSNLPMIHLLAGTAYFDATANPKENYVYKISLKESGDRAVSQLESNPTSLFKKPVFPVITFADKSLAGKNLMISWSTDDPLQMAHFNVYRSVYGKNEFHKLDIKKGAISEKGKLKLFAVDSLGSSPAWYEYRIAAVDAYGNEGDLQAITDGTNIAEYYSPPVTNLKAVNTKQNHEVRLSWHYESKKYLNGITIMRSSNYDTGYVNVATIPVTDSTYTDILPVSGENYYYYLLLHSAENNTLPTARVFAAYTDNNSKPQAPQMLSPKQVQNGAKITWKSDELYAKGFFVYRRDNLTAPFTQASSLIPAQTGSLSYSYTDTSSILQADGVYQYIVRTINEDSRLSDPSDTITINPNIKKAVTTPMNLRYRIDEGKLMLMWDDMSRWEKNMVGYKIYRKSGNDAFVSLDSGSFKMKNFFSDPGYRPSAAEYTYAVSTLDISGNESEKATIIVSVETEDLPGPPSGIKATQSENNIVLSWGQVAGNIGAVNIYRSESGGTVKLIGTVSDTDSFVDKNISDSKLYFYQVAFVSSLGKEGERSEKVSVRVR